MKSRKENAFGKLSNLQTKKIPQTTKILKFKLTMKENFERFYYCNIRTSDDNIINVNNDSNKNNTNSLGEKIVVRLRLMKAMLNKSNREFTIPLPLGLF